MGGDEGEGVLSLNIGHGQNVTRLKVSTITPSLVLPHQGGGNKRKKLPHQGDGIKKRNRSIKGEGTKERNSPIRGTG